MNDDREYKALAEFEIKDAERGEVEAVVANFGVVDHDRDVIAPGAIKDGAKVKLSSYGHDTVLAGAAPVGKGVVRVDGQRAVLKAQFFMSTQRGREAFATVKEMGADGEWSIGFTTKRIGDLTDEWKAQGAERVLAALDVFEVSPVLRGAQPFTGTLAVKEAESSTVPHPEPAVIPPEPVVDTKAAELAAVAAEEFERFQKTRRYLES